MKNIPWDVAIENELITESTAFDIKSLSLSINTLLSLVPQALHLKFQSIMMKIPWFRS